MEPESDCVSDCRFSGAGSTIKPENTQNIWFRITRPLFNLVENLNAGAVETLLRGVITSAVSIGQAIQLYARSEIHLDGGEEENIPILSGS